MQQRRQEQRQSSSASDNKSYKLRRLDSFLSRVTKPGYFRSASPKKLTEDLDQACLDEQARLIKQRIAEFEHKRKDLAVLEVIESTMKEQSVPIWERFGFWSRARFAIPTPFSCIRTRKSKRILEDYQGLERAAATSSNLPTGALDIGKIAAKKLMLQNEQRIQWSKNLQAKVRGAMSLRRKLHAPVYAISQELWGYIFLFCLSNQGRGDKKAGDEYVEPDRNSAPLLFCSVCHTWRIAAIRTHALWASLVIRLHGQSETRRVFIQTWIRRAGNLPLALHIIWEPTGSLECYDTILEDVRSLARRWKSLKLSILKGLLWQLHSFPSRARNLLEGRMTRLERLTVDTYVSFAGDVKTIQKKAPKLRVLVLGNSDVDPMDIVLAPWSKLAVFRSCFPLGMSQAHAVFKYCPNLEECEIAVMACPVLDRPRAMLRMPYLKKLTINETTMDVLNTLFLFLQLPELEELNLNAESSWVSVGRTQWSAGELLFMVHRSVEDGEIKMKSLRMRDIACRDHVVESIRRTIPGLVTLDMDFREVEVLEQCWTKTLRIGSTNYGRESTVLP